MDEHRLPSLNGIRSFVAAARHLSFTAAARELNVTQGAVSRSVQALEAELGVPLFRRVGRAIELTPAGAIFYPQVAEAMGRIAAASQSLRRLEEGGVLSISLLPTFALRWLVPRLHRFQQRHPDILVDVSTSEHVVDFASESIDLALRYGTGQWPGAEATLFMREEMGVFCAPGVPQQIPLNVPADLRAHRLLVHTSRSEAWAEFFATHGVVAPDNVPSPGFEHFFMIAEAAALGMGVALLPVFLVREEVARGRLVQPFPQVLRPAKAYYLLHGPGRIRSRKIRLFKEWLLEEGASA
ncbi:transcriptional regulator GcvA [Arenibaculum pallidiluteum]|uniref:transcriptional regulator GcvA n=1 Tax=Arenibaculum pallidiluteum TaxID=2812559 RepID=UPI001A95BC9A|nr:transcriptional regulator GcvA [Arenibaculum pallidiluteum]